jgi:FkbM family methyltransferase
MSAGNLKNAIGSVYGRLISNQLLKSAEKLKDEISLVYGRLTSNQLLKGDVVNAEDYSKLSDPLWMQEIYDRNVVMEHDALVFSRFRADMGAILDIGAHWGYMALSIRLSGTTCPIVSFEALETHRPCLQRLKELDTIGYDFKISAVSDREGDVTLYGPVVNGTPIYGLNSIDGSIFANWHADFITTLIGTSIPLSKLYKIFPLAKKYRFQLLETKLHCKPLDLLLAEGGFAVPIEKIAALKVDVEGHEPQVLRGAAITIARDRPFILVEAGNRNPSVVEILQSYGYVYATLEGDRIFEGRSTGLEVNGGWYHISRAEEYTNLGFLVSA